MKTTYRLVEPPFAAGYRVSPLAEFAIVAQRGLVGQVLTAYIPGKHTHSEEEARVFFMACIRVMQKLSPDEALRSFRLSQLRDCDLSTSSPQATPEAVAAIAHFGNLTIQ